MNILSNRKGNSLLIVIVATFVLLATSLYISKFTVNEVKISNDLSKALNARYAAESGIEKALFLVRESNISLNNVISNPSYNKTTLSNGASYSIVSNVSTTPNTYTVQVDSIPGGQPYSLDITNYLEKSKSIKISWSANGNELLNIGIAKFVNYWGWNIFAGYDFLGSYNHYADSPLVLNVSANSYYDDTDYVLYLFSMFYDISNVTIAFYTGPNATGTVLDPSQSTGQSIKSIGNMGNNNISVYSDFLINEKF